MKPNSDVCYKCPHKIIVVPFRPDVYPYGSMQYLYCNLHKPDHLMEEYRIGVDYQGGGLEHNEGHADSKVTGVWGAPAFAFPVDCPYILEHTLRNRQ